MPQRRRILEHSWPWLIAAVCGATSACIAPKPKRDPGRHFASNSVDRAGLMRKLDDLSMLVGRAAALVPAAGGAALALDDTDAGDACASPIELFSSGAAAPSGALSLQPGSSCEEALAGLRAFYAENLQAVRLGSARLREVDAGTGDCGLSAELLPVNEDVAALKARLTPTAPTDGRTFSEDIQGAATNESVEYIATATASCEDGDGGCAPGGATSVSASLRSEGFGALRGNAMRVADRLEMQSVSPGADGGAPVESAMTLLSQLTFTELGTLPRVEEKTVVDRTVGGAATHDELQLFGRVLSDDRLHLSGRVVRAGVESPFDVTIATSSGRCVITAVEEGGGDGGGGDVDAASLAGEWRSDCSSAELGRLGERHYEESWRLDGEGVLTKTLTAYSDSECFPGKELLTLTQTGHWTAGARLGAESADGDAMGAGEIAIDVQYDRLQVLPGAAELAQQLADDEVCGSDAWRAGAPQRFEPGACYLDLGGEPLLNMASMKRAAEFLAVAPKPGRLMDVARTTTFQGDAADGRARVGDGWRRLKRQP
jgi:hypothetical protein